MFVTPYISLSRRPFLSSLYKILLVFTVQRIGTINLDSHGSGQLAGLHLISGTAKTEDSGIADDIGNENETTAGSVMQKEPVRCLAIQLSYCAY